METYEEWKKRLAGLSDWEISEELRKKITSSDGFDEQSKKIFNIIYDYFAERAKKGKDVNVDLLKIHLKEMHGYDPEQIDIPSMLILLNLCGINTGKMVNKARK